MLGGLAIRHSAGHQPHDAELGLGEGGPALGAHLDRALRLYVDAGASWDATRVRGRLAALGVRRRLVPPARTATVGGRNNST